MLRDILDAIAMIEVFTEGMGRAEFVADSKTIAAVERKLLTISEAGVRMRGTAEIICPGIPWRDIRGMGNWIRHQYDRVDVDILWNTVVRYLPELKAACTTALAVLRKDTEATET